MRGILFATAKNFKKIKDEGISEQVIAMSESLREERKLETERMIDREMYSVNS